MNQKSVIFFILGAFWINVFLDVKNEPYLCNGCHDLMQKTMNFNVAIVSVKGSDYGIHFWYMSKNNAINGKF